MGVASKAGLSGPAWAGWAGLITSVSGTFGFVSLGFLADAIGRKPTAMLWYTMCLVLTPLVYLWGASWGFVPLLVLVGVFGFFTLGIWAWAPVWLPELFPTRMRGTAVAFCFNAPRFISCLGPLIAGTLIPYFGGFGPAATIVGLFFILGVVAAPFLPETNGTVPTSALESAVVIAFKIKTETGLMSFFSTTTVFGTPVDVTLSELALELFFPADDETAAAVQRMTGSGSPRSIVTAH
jgi:MFS family permease